MAKFNHKAFQKGVEFCSTDERILVGNVQINSRTKANKNANEAVKRDL